MKFTSKPDRDKLYHSKFRTMKRAISTLILLMVWIGIVCGVDWPLMRCRDSLKLAQAGGGTWVNAICSLTDEPITVAICNSISVTECEYTMGYSSHS